MMPTVIVNTGVTAGREPDAATTDVITGGTTLLTNTLSPKVATFMILGQEPFKYGTFLREQKWDHSFLQSLVLKLCSTAKWMANGTFIRAT